MWAHAVVSWRLRACYSARAGPAFAIAGRGAAIILSLCHLATFFTYIGVCVPCPVVVVLHHRERCVRGPCSTSRPAVCQHALERRHGSGSTRFARVGSGSGNLVPAVLVSPLRLRPAAVA